MTFLYLKALHIIFIVTWFAGLFYMPRLLIYLTEAHSKSEHERSVLIPQLKLMARRLWYGITWPSSMITLGLGTALIVNDPGWLEQGYMHVKLTLVFLLYCYHGSLQYIFNLLSKDLAKYSSQQLRIWNEVATIFLIGIVFAIVMKDAISMVWGLAGLLIVMILIFSVVKLYKKYRHEK